jgi:hypothetical protein
MEINDGTTFILKALEWREDWEFDHPTVILEPVFRYSPNGNSIEYMVESLCIDGCVDGKLETHDYEQEFTWRGWSLENLKRVYLQCLKGKKFPQKQYKAAEYKIKFYLDNHDELVFSSEKLF